MNGGGWIPSEAVILQAIQEHGQDFRLETEGKHPVSWLQEPVREEDSRLVAPDAIPAGFQRAYAISGQ